MNINFQILNRFKETKNRAVEAQKHHSDNRKKFLLNLRELRNIAVTIVQPFGYDVTHSESMGEICISKKDASLNDSVVYNLKTGNGLNELLERLTQFNVEFEAAEKKAAADYNCANVILSPTIQNLLDTK